MDYLWLKALHVAAVLVWVGGVLAAALAVRATGDAAQDDAGRMQLLRTLRAWDGRVTAVAMLLVWGFGLALASRGGWFGAHWLWAKLALVLWLSALHGLVSGRLRRIAQGTALSSSPLARHAPAGIVLTVLAIAVLVVVKPF